jgi:hypothetical protein
MIGNMEQLQVAGAGCPECPEQDVTAIVALRRSQADWLLNRSQLLRPALYFSAELASQLLQWRVQGHYLFNVWRMNP